ncbi:MAG TPA: CocE/NonD family hydrolase [Longimicrobiales bacterium]
MEVPVSKCQMFLWVFAGALSCTATGVMGQDLRTEEHWVAADDGTRLHTTVYLPEGAGPHPVVLIRSPYSGQRGTGMRFMAERLVPAGYAVVEQDVRGTGRSEGQFIPFVFDSGDGRATLDWVSSQPWAAAIGLWGVSYPGWAAYAAASTGHPSIAAMVVGSSYGDLAEFLSPGGAFHLMAHVPWMMGFGPGGQGRLPPRDALEALFRTLPIGDLLRGQELIAEFARQPFDWTRVDVPTLHWTGWYDYIYRDALTGYSMLADPAHRHGASQRLIVGPWIHAGELNDVTRVGAVDFGPSAAAGLDSVAAWARRFFDHHLRGLPIEGEAVRVFFLGDNVWRTFDRWPPAEATLQTWYIAPDAALVRRLPGAGSAGFRYDPNDPVPTVGGVVSHFFPENAGPRDQRILDERPDILRFTSSVLDTDLILAGPMMAFLYLTADAPAIDVTVKLVLLKPDGRAEIVEDGIRRIPRLGADQEVVVKLGHRAIHIPAGSRLRLDISGGNFPKYDRNPQNGEDPFTAAVLHPASIVLSAGGGQPSRLEIYVMPNEGAR